MTFVITTPLYYVNDKPHLGSVYTTIICDSIARYKRLVGEEVIFITGVDEHGLKIQRTANEKGIAPKSHCDEISEVFNNNWKVWNISFDKFIRTSSKNHEFVVNELRSSGNYALAFLSPKRPGGITIDILKTPGFQRGSLEPNYMDGTAVVVLYEKKRETWVAVHHSIGATDVWFSETELCSQYQSVIPEFC